MALALLVAQAINFTLIYGERMRLGRTQAEGPAIGRFVLVAQRLATLGPARRVLEIPRYRRSRIWVAEQSAVPTSESDPHLLERLRESVAANGVRLREVRAMATEQAPVGPVIRDDLPPD